MTPISTAEQTRDFVEWLLDGHGRVSLVNAFQSYTPNILISAFGKHMEFPADIGEVLPTSDRYVMIRDKIYESDLGKSLQRAKKLKNYELHGNRS